MRHLCPHPTVQYLLPWRSFHDLTHAPMVATLSPGPGSAQGTHLQVIDAFTGALTASTPLQYAVDKV